MNPNIMECDDHKLKLLLAADEQAVEHDPWMQHVERCSHCQSRLRELAAQADDWQKAAEVLAADDDDAPYFGRDHDVPSSWNESMVKQLLEPPSHPEMLGRLGRYEMERMIGCGGMGIVFKAFDTELNRVVAVKLLAPYLAARGSARKRFAREARAAAGVRDDHVVPIFNVESEHEPPFLVMQYVAGGSLQEKLDRDGPLEVAEVLRIGLQTAKGLAAAHAQGLIHRDVKPSNILLDEGVERALLTDFGLARAEDDACLTRSGFHPGTPHYMSPEQVRGEAIDGRSDLFSLGCVLYALCTGHSPFRAETSYAVMRRITDECPRPIREQNANIPEWLEAIVMKLLSKSRDDRFASAKEVAELLEDCLAHVHQPATTPLPVGVQALAAQSVSASTESLQANRLKARHQRIPPIGKYIAAAAGAAALFFAGILIVLELGKGTLTIESELDNVPIRIMQGNKVVEKMTVSKSGNSVRVAAGTYVVELDAKLDGIVVENESILLKRGDSEQIRIRYAKPLANSSEGSTPDKFSQSLQGEWEYVSVETDGVTIEYKTLKPQWRIARLKVAGDRWTVHMGDGTTVLDSNRVEVDGNKLTFDVPGLGNEDLRSICYGLFEVDGDALTYLMTPVVAEGALNGQGLPLIEFPDSFETKGTENKVFRLRRIHPSTPPTSTSSTNSSTSKSSPEFPPIKIVVHDEEGKPLEGVKVSLIQLAKDQGGQVLEINETSNASGLAVNRNLPYGHYELSATTADGWYLTGLRSRLNVEFEKGIDAILVAPTPGKTSQLVISSDVMTSPDNISGLRFGGLTEDRWTHFAPEPEGSDSFKEKEFSSFPSITNGIEYVGAEIRLEIWRSISQPAPSMQQMNTRWYWSRPPNSKVSFRYLIANGQARSFNEGNTPQNESLKLPPVEGSELFKLPSPNYRVDAELLKLREPTQLPLELDIPAGDVRVRIGRFLGKPSAAVLAALNWQPREQQPELWLQAYLAPDSAWVERLINIDWINSPFRSGGSVGFTALWRDQALQPGERLEIPLGMKQVSAVDHGSVRSVVEAYVAAAMANDRKTVQSLTRGNPQEPEQLAKAIDALMRNLTKLDSLAAPTVFVNSPDCPSKGIALTETLKWEPRINPSDDLMDVRLRFELSKSDQRWSVTEIGIETEKLADELLTKFLEDNPTAISVLSQSRTEKPSGGNTKFLVLDCEEIDDFRRILGLSQLEELYINQFVHPGTDFKILKALPHLRKLTFSKWSGLSSGEIAAIAESLPGIEFVEEENQVNRKDARSVVEAYVASALAGDVAQTASLAKNSPADPKRIRELPEILNVQRLKIQTVYINDPAKPTQALATSVAVKLDEEHKNPDGRRDGFLVFTLEFTDEKWFVIDIDFETDARAEEELNKFLKANPNSIGIPPQLEDLSR